MGRSRGTRLALHAAAWLVGLSVFRVGLIPPQLCGPVDQGQIDTAIEMTASWAELNLDETNRFLYRYDRSTATNLGGYNLVRHAGMTNALFQLAAEGDQSGLAAADRSLEYLFGLTVGAGVDGLAVADRGQEAKLGTAALTVAALVHRRRATGDRIHDQIARSLGRFLVGQIQPNGAPLGFFDVNANTAAPDRFGLFATGEAAWALALLESEFPDEGWSTEAARIVVYVANERRDQESYLLRQPDHWVAYAMAELGAELVNDLPGVPAYADRLGGDFALMSRVEPQRTQGGIQGTLRFGQALGAGVGAMGEGLGNLAMIAQASTELGSGPLEGRSEEVLLRLECTASLLVDRQIDKGGVESNDDHEIGAWFTDDVTQVDDQQHTLSALLLARKLLFEPAEVPKQ